MISCPHCKVRLERVEEKNGVQWRCASCEGRAVNLPVVRRLLKPDYVNQLWRAARDRTEAPGLGCPLCRNDMRVVQHLAADEASSLDVDVCVTCHTVWFDPHELDTLRSHVGRKQAPPAPRLPQKAREIVALARVRQIREQADREDQLAGVPPADGWQAVLSLFGIPVEENAPPLSRWPWVTWVTLFLMFVATAWSQWGNPGAIAEWGFLAADPLRHGGLTLVTGFFLHGGWLHLLGNAVFLFVFGDNVEDYLGHFRFALLLLGASLAGDLVHMTWETRAVLPMVGASGGISGVIAFYALQFPKARFVYFLRFGVFMRWVRFSALSGFLVWCLLQAVGLVLQLGGHSNISVLAHLGGAVFGLFWWYSSRLKNKPMDDLLSLS